MRPKISTPAISARVSGRPSVGWTAVKVGSSLALMRPLSRTNWLLRKTVTSTNPRSVGTRVWATKVTSGRMPLSGLKTASLGTSW